MLTQAFHLVPSSKNDYLTSIEAKRHRLSLDRKSLHDLEQKVADYLTDMDPTKVISQNDFADLLNRGVIDYSQAFLIYELFHQKRMHTDEYLNLDNDTYILFDTIPVCGSINVLLSIIVLFLFLSQMCNMK